MKIVGLQEWIHKMEVGSGANIVKAFTAGLAFIALALTYDLREYQNFSTAEAMDAAQLARNLAEGRGYTTQFIRPLDLHLLRERGGGDPRLDNSHPDLANAPGWPWLLAGLMQKLPFNHAIAQPKEFQRHTPEVWIAWFNQGLFFLSLCLLFFLARWLFDDLVAWLSVVVLGGAELYWRFSVSGLSTLLLVLEFLLLVWFLALAEKGARERRWGLLRLAPLALIAGALVGVCGLTRYACGWLILPVAVYFVIAFQERRLTLALAALVGFIVVMTPWISRNYEVSGTLFGTAGYALYEDGERFPGNNLERTLQPHNVNSPIDLGKTGMDEHWRKFLRNARVICQEELPKLGGSWFTAFFLVGLLVPFNSPTLSRLRAFLVMALLTFIVVEALGRTQLSGDSPTVNSENLLVILAPLMFVFGAGLFSLLLDQTRIELVPARNLMAGVACLIVCAPLLFALLTPRRSALAYPPYHPPVIQETAGWLEESELMMSDAPWAVAWYGRRSCLWLTLDHEASFASIHKEKPIRGLYLTQLTLDRKLVSEMMPATEPWGRFAMETLSKQEIPTGFPLKHAFAEWFPNQLFLADRPRWEKAGNR